MKDVNVIPILNKLTSLSRVAGHFGIELHEEGNRIVGDCPFCKAKGKFAVRDDIGCFHCFACENSGDMIDLYGRLKGTNFNEAVLGVLFLAAKDAESKS